MAFADDIARRVKRPGSGKDEGSYKAESVAARKYDPSGNDSLVAPADKGAPLKDEGEDMAVDHGRLILSAIANKDGKALKEAIRDCVADINSGEDY